MAIRVPLLLERVAAIIHRLDVATTRAVDPPGAGTTGYDEDFREPVVYDAGTVRTDSRTELPAVRVPCQTEVLNEDRLRQAFSGAVPSSNLVIVLHRRDLERQGLLDATTREPIIRVNDRVSTLERIGFPGRVVRQLGPGGAGLFVFEVRGASWGFGPEGHDLELLYLNDRPRAL